MDCDGMFLSPIATLLEPDSKLQSHCTPYGNCVPLDDSAIRLSCTPWLHNLVLPFTIFVEKGGSVAG